MKKLPVFVFPISLEFYLAARHTYKQLLTLYNPCDFAVKFQVMCTSPHKFTVTDPEGVIAPLSCVDVVLRYSQPSSIHCNSSDKFRITMHDRITNQLLGKRIVVAKFLAGEPEGGEGQDERSEAFQPLAGRSSALTTCPPGCTQHRSEPSGVVIAVCAVCVCALLLPPHVQERLQLSPNVQLVCSFILGLFTMLLIRPAP